MPRWFQKSPPKIEIEIRKKTPFVIYGWVPKLMLHVHDFVLPLHPNSDLPLPPDSQAQENWNAWERVY